MKISIKREQNDASINSAEREKFGAMLKTIKMISLAAVALLTAACSNSDDFETVQPKAEIAVTQTIPALDNAAMRTILTEESDGIKAAWKVGDQIAIAWFDDEDNGHKRVATITAVDSDGKATISFTVPDGLNVSKVSLVSPASAVSDGGIIDYAALENQDGNLNSSLDIRSHYHNNNTIDTSASPILSLGDARFEPVVCFLHLTLTGTAGLDTTHPLVIKNGNTSAVLYTVTPTASNTTELWVAVRPEIYPMTGNPTSLKYIFSATAADGKSLNKTGTATLNPGKCYNFSLAFE